LGFKYANITLQTINQQEVALYLNTLQRKAFVLPATKGFVIACDEECDQDNSLLLILTNQLSVQFGCIGIGIINFDDDILWYQLYQNGKLLDEYNSNPDYFENGEHRGPIGGNPQILCELFNKPTSIVKVGKILRALPGEGYTFENDRHSDLAKTLGWASPYLRLGYKDLAALDDGKDDLTLFARPLPRQKLKQFTETDPVSRSFDLDKELLKLLRRKKKISAIVLYQQHKLCPLAEAKQYVDGLEKQRK